MLNKVILMGRLTKDPEIRFTSTNNIPIARFSLAVDRNFRQGEERQADFINCIAWNKTADFVEKYFTKGKMMTVVGRIQTGSFEKDGKKVYTTDVVCEEVGFGESKKGNTPANNAPAEEGGFVPVDYDENELPF